MNDHFTEVKDESLKEHFLKGKYCPSPREFNLKGNYYSEEFTYASIEIIPCYSEYGYSNCKDKASVDKFLDSATLNFIFSNT